MRFLVASFGTAGDVLPFLALGRTLQARGHRVTVLASGDFQDLAGRLDLELVPLATAEEMAELTHQADFWHPLRGARLVARWGAARLPRQYQEIAARCGGGDTVVAASVGVLGARLAEEKLGVPAASVVLQPGIIRSVERPPAFPGIPSSLLSHSPRLVRRLFFRGLDALAAHLVGGPLEKLRRELGLPPVRSFFEWWLSPRLVLGLFPGWYGASPGDWPPQIRLTAFPLCDALGGERLPEEARAFLEAGDPPIVFTPGTGVAHAHGFFRTALEAAEALGRRALFLTRIAEQVPAPLPPAARHFPYLPLSLVLPWSACLVHHGGVGTAARAMAAGVPQLILPMAYDQKDNAERVKRLGVGDSLSRRRLTARRLAAKLGELLESPRVQASCLETAARCRGPDPLESVCEHLEALGRGAAAGVRP